MEGNIGTPELTTKEGGIQYSDWVLGQYHANLICPYRIVRYYKDKNTSGWEYADNQAEDEDIFDIGHPDCWFPLNVGG